VTLGWVLGFVDGEGCFSVGFVRQLGDGRRRGYRTGWQVAHEFAVAQGASSMGCLEALRRFFGVGAVIVNRRHDNHREPMQRFVVRKRVDLLETVIRSSRSTRSARRSARTSRSSRRSSG
jgi:hypothetical protein